MMDFHGKDENTRRSWKENEDNAGNSGRRSHAVEERFSIGLGAPIFAKEILCIKISNQKEYGKQYETKALITQCSWF